MLTLPSPLSCVWNTQWRLYRLQILLLCIVEVEKEQEEYKIGGQRSTLAERPLAVIMIIDFGGSGGGGVARVYDAPGWQTLVSFPQLDDKSRAPYITVSRDGWPTHTCAFPFHRVWTLHSPRVSRSNLTIESLTNFDATLFSNPIWWSALHRFFTNKREIRKWMRVKLMEKCRRPPTVQT